MSGAGIVWIASYPKSGNTWLRCLLASLRAGGAAPDLDKLGKCCPNAATRSWLEETTGVATDDMSPSEIADLRAAAHRQAARAADGPIFLKAHDAFDARLFPAEATRGVVHIVRDPRDVAPSFAAHLARPLDHAIRAMADASFTLSRSRKTFAPQAEQRLDGWSGHAASWAAGATRPRLFVRYEDLLAEPVGETRRLSEFLGLAADEATIARAVAVCGFDTLRTVEERSGFREKPKMAERFFRQGRAGAWREGLSAAQAARIEGDHGEMMRKLGYAA